MRSPEIPTLDKVAYLVTWSMVASDRLKLIRIRGVIREDHHELDVLDVEVGPNERNISIPLEYYRTYLIYIAAVYDVGLIETYAVSSGVRIDAIVGFSNPVRQLTANQDGFGDLVTLIWKHPRLSNGPLDFYEILVTDENGTVVLPR